MGAHQRVLDDHDVRSLDEHRELGGCAALDAARAVNPVALIETIEASGLRGRGGAGFPTGTKWRTVAGMGGAEPATVVVNAAEGEPGTLKDRTLVRRNPYRVLEGALIAALAVAADRVLIGFKSSARTERRRMDDGLLDVRVLFADGRPRTRGALALAFGGRTDAIAARMPFLQGPPALDSWTTGRIEIEGRGDDPGYAHDGEASTETPGNPRRLTITLHAKGLRVYSPAR